MSHCIAKIHANYHQFSKTEKKIADYILDTPENLVHKTIDQVAEDLDVAISTVFRFSKRLGFKGFQAMKIALAAEVAEPIKDIVQAKIEENDNEQAITEKIFNTNIRMFKETIQVMDFSSIKNAVSVILKSNRVEFYGTGDASIVALDAHHKFIGSGISTAAYTEPYLQIKAVSQLTDRDVAVIISHTANDENSLQIVQAAKERGAAVIAITTYSNTQLSQRADVTLNVVSGSGVPPMDASFLRIIQLSLIDSLYHNVISMKNSFLKNPIDKLKNYFK
ncbi:MurR/RpiR family transcriptional regulator [Virgibacillus senegalensis]|uniref:MurR/RpiR family transcriptional regulator n=1 Tax=Virgibacillus senegalensis TaxID=1499679 RepID=UPI000AC11617|nr:MurR/RpiR family transcriptional regulator [Virgibacillus senegalensis]